MAVKQRRKQRTTRTRGKGKPFVKGDARINRAGRPLVGESLAEAVRAAGDEVVKGETVRDATIRELWSCAAEGDRDAAALLFNRGWGRAVADEDLIKRIDELEKRLNRGDGQDAS